MSAHDRPQFKVSLLKLSRALAGNPEPCAAQRLMEYPFFGLAKTRCTMPTICGFNRIAATIRNAELFLPASQAIKASDTAMRSSYAAVPRHLGLHRARCPGAELPLRNVDELS
jgi:hypothetical protein